MVSSLCFFMMRFPFGTRTRYGHTKSRLVIRRLSIRRSFCFGLNWNPHIENDSSLSRHLGFLRCQVARPFWVVPDAPPVLHRRQRDTRLICVIARNRFGLLVTLNEGGLLPLVQIFSTAHFSKARAFCLSTELPNNSTKRVFWVFVLWSIFLCETSNVCFRRSNS